MLEIKKSTIPNAGLGIFAKKTYKKGDWITDYSGKYVNSKQYEKLINERDFNTLYYSIYNQSNNKTLIGDSQFKNDISQCGHLINDISNINYNEIFDNNKIKEYIYSKKNTNVDFVIDGDKIQLFARRNILKNEELFTHYGVMYWIDSIINNNSKKLVFNQKSYNNFKKWAEKLDYKQY